MYGLKLIHIGTYDSIIVISIGTRVSIIVNISSYTVAANFIFRSFNFTRWKLKDENGHIATDQVL